jgi:hypothetical protein
MSEEKVKSRNEDLARAFRPDREVIQVGGEAIYIAELSAEDALSIEAGKDYIYHLLARAIVDKDGKRRFGNTPEDIAEIKRWGSRKIRPLIKATVRLNGLDEEPEKNSGGGPSAA